MKGKDEKPKKNSEEPDYEKMYYQAMKENVLYKDRKISLEFTTEEITLLRSVMFEELYEVLQGSYYMNEMNPDDDEENKVLQRKADDELLRKLRTEHQAVIESIITKLRFET